MDTRVRDDRPAPGTAPRVAREGALRAAEATRCNPIRDATYVVRLGLSSHRPDCILRTARAALHYVVESLPLATNPRDR